MKLPGFNAEVSTYKSNNNYRTLAKFYGKSVQQVMPTMVEAVPGYWLARFFEGLRAAVSAAIGSGGFPIPSCKEYCVWYCMDEPDAFEYCFWDCVAYCGGV